MEEEAFIFTSIFQIYFYSRVHDYVCVSIWHPCVSSKGAQRRASDLLWLALPVVESYSPWEQVLCYPLWNKSKCSQPLNYHSSSHICYFWCVPPPPANSFHSVLFSFSYKIPLALIAIHIGGNCFILHHNVFIFLERKFHGILNTMFVFSVCFVSQSVKRYSPLSGF